ncbi:MAG: RloB family protein [Prevotella sp.]|nr:RloB family protein [Prevotella sp.]
MPYKKRTYYKIEEEKARDYSLFVIVTEGTKTEPNYFQPFDEIDRIKVRLLKPQNGDTSSAPSYIQERAQHYIAEEGLDTKYGDSLWCVIDVDKWNINMITSLGQFCLNTGGCNLVVSNPYFEIWLLYHKLSDLSNIDCSSSHKVKIALSNISPGGYFFLDYIPLMEKAIVNARSNDSAPGLQHYMPKIRETKVYEMAQALINCIGKRRWEHFINVILPDYKKKIYEK